MDFNNYDIIHTFLEDEIIDENVLQRCLDIFVDDTSAGFDFMEYFYGFYCKIHDYYTDSIFETMDQIATKYIELCTQREVLAQLYAIKMKYYFYIGVNSKAIEWSLKINDLGTIDVNLSLDVNIYFVEMLVHDAENIEVSVKYLNSIFDNSSFFSQPTGMRVFAYCLLARINALTENVNELSSVYRQIAAIIRDLSVESKKVYQDYVSLVELNIKCILYKKNARYNISLLHLSNNFANLFPTIISGKKFVNDTMEIVINILDTIKSMLSKEQIIYYCKELIKNWKCNNFEKILVYNFIYENCTLKFSEENYYIAYDFANAMRNNFIAVKNVTKDNTLSTIVNSEFESRYRETEKVANMDYLTGCFNRTYLMAKENSFDEFRGFMIFFDMDKLKRINDVYGHNFGDEYLISFTKAVKQAFPNNSELIRVGGDEFVLLYNISNKMLVIQAMQHLIELCNSKIKISNDNISGRFSAGIVTINTSQQLSDVLTRSDNTMYQAKRNKDVWYYFEEDVK